MKPVRIAVLGIDIECHRRAPPTTLDDVRRFGLWRGDEVHDLLALGQAYGFAAQMSALRSWEPVPILVAHGSAGGPMVHADYLRLRHEIEQRLRQAGSLDAVYIDAHGAGMTTELDDLDGDYFQHVRSIVGAVPIVATLDLHGKVSRAMLTAADALVAMRTNPHLDLPARRDEAARLLHRLLAGERLHSVSLRLPLLTPQVTQLTRPDQPLGELMSLAESRIDGDLANLSLLPGFAFSDTADNGFNIVAASWHSTAHAQAAVQAMATEVWARRGRFTRQLTSIADAVRLATQARCGGREQRRVLADVADNPGGGGRGNTVWLLEALAAAGARGVVLGPVWDPPLVADAWSRGVGARFDAVFNRDPAEATSGTFRSVAQVQALRAGPFVVRHGVQRGLPVDLGRTCLLSLGGILVAVSELREQTYAADYLTHCGVEVDAVATFVVKSRGHFRAGFDHLVADDRIVEVDAPGLTTPDLHRNPWHHLQRPIAPLDADVQWPPDAR